MRHPRSRNAGLFPLSLGFVELIQRTVGNAYVEIAFMYASGRRKGAPRSARQLRTLRSNIGFRIVNRYLANDLRVLVEAAHHIHPARIGGGN